MKPKILIDLEALYRLYFDRAIDKNTGLLYTDKKFEYSAVVEKIRDYLKQQGLVNYELIFFSHADTTVIGSKSGARYVPSIFDTLGDYSKIRIAEQHEIHSRDVLKLEQVSHYIGQSQGPILVVSPDDKFLASLPEKIAKLRVSKSGELELPNTSFLKKLSEKIHLLYDLNAALLQFRTYATGRLALNPSLKNFMLELRDKHHQGILSVDFQPISAAIQGEARGYELHEIRGAQEWDRRFLNYCLPGEITRAMKNWFVEQGMAEEFGKNDIFYTEAGRRLEMLYGEYRQTSPYERPSHLVLVDNKGEYDLHSVSTELYRRWFQENLKIKLHVIGVRQQGELLPGWEQLLTNFAQVCVAAVAEKEAQKRYQLFKSSEMSHVFPISEEDESATNPAP